MKYLLVTLTLLSSMASFADVSVVKFNKTIKFDGVTRSVSFLKGRKVKLTKATGSGKDHCEINAASAFTTEKIEKGTILEVESYGPVDHYYSEVIAGYRIKFLKNDLKINSITCNSLRMAGEELSIDNVKDVFKSTIDIE